MLTTERPNNRVYEIVHSYTGEVLADVSASCATDALALVSDAEGYADPREAAVAEAECGREADGRVWADPYVLRPDGLLGMIMTNYEVHAQLSLRENDPAEVPGRLVHRCPECGERVTTDMAEMANAYGLVAIIHAECGLAAGWTVA